MAIFFFLILFFCGSERTDVKHLSDHAKINFQDTLHSSISNEIALKAPKLPSARTKDEYTLVQVTCKIIKIGLEDDKDFHLVFSDGKHTMIGEIPDETCSESIQSGHATEYAACRKWITEHLGTVKAKFRKCSLQATITGVRFFDKLHRQTGVARNGVEIHPITGIQ